MAEDSLRDISVTGSNPIAVFDIDGLDGEVLVDDLFYEGQVVQFENMDMGGSAVDANGRFYSWRKRTPVSFTITVFAGSKTDMSLANTMVALLADKGQYVKIKNAVWRVAHGYKMEFTDGTMTSWLPAVNANADNRQGPKTYRFSFAGVKVSKV